MIGSPLPHEGVTTVSGWVTGQLGGFPKSGDTLNVAGFQIRVEEVDGMRVGRLKLTKAAP